MTLRVKSCNLFFSGYKKKKLHFHFIKHHSLSFPSLEAILIKTKRSWGTNNPSLFSLHLFNPDSRQINMLETNFLQWYLIWQWLWQCLKVPKRFSLQSQICKQTRPIIRVICSQFINKKERDSNYIITKLEAWRQRQSEGERSTVELWRSDLRRPLRRSWVSETEKRFNFHGQEEEEEDEQ